MAHVITEIFRFFEVIAICITALIALLLVLLAIPKSPIRDIAIGLTQRLGATAAAVALMPPMDMIPVTGEIYDVAAIVGVAYYWYTLFKKQQAPRIEG